MTTQSLTSQSGRNAYLQHGEPGGPYQTEAVPLRETETLPRKGQTRNGYGKRIPTNFQIKWHGRWYRVLCICFSNSGTLYIRVSKEVTERRMIIVTIQ